VTRSGGTPLRVAVDAGPIVAERSGVGHTTAALLEHLAARDDLEVSGYAISRRGRDALAGLLPLGVSAATSPIPARVAHGMWRHAGRPRLEAWSGPVDVVHATNFVAPPARAPVLVTVHDLAYAHSPELCLPETLEYDGLVRRALDRGATVHTVSDHVREEVIAHYGLPEARVVRVHFGVEAVGPAGDAARGRAIARSTRYVLALSTIEPRKNHPALVRAFDAVADDDPELVLVIAGGLAWGAEALDRAVAASAHTGRVRVLGYVNDTARADLLAGATALAYPSLYEGFGHPPFEAMSAGVPVLASRTGSIPEAVGDAALLVDPRDDDALAAGLSRITTDESLRAELRARGAEQVRRYPWSRAVEEFVALYRQLAA
jgi:glycosyltransferase involved in cell wall biosynthesis